MKRLADDLSDVDTVIILVSTHGVRENGVQKLYFSDKLDKWTLLFGPILRKEGFIKIFITQCCRDEQFSQSDEINVLNPEMVDGRLTTGYADTITFHSAQKGQ